LGRLGNGLAPAADHRVSFRAACRSNHITHSNGAAIHGRSETRTIVPMFCQTHVRPTAPDAPFVPARHTDRVPPMQMRSCFGRRWPAEGIDDVLVNETRS
jgi:hypothetical protein